MTKCLPRATHAAPLEGPHQLSRVPRTTIGEVGRMAEKPIVLPESFSAEESWEDWLDHLNNVAAVNSWDGEQKLLWLKVHMTGKLRQHSRSCLTTPRGPLRPQLNPMVKGLSPRVSGSCTLPNFRCATRGRQKAGPISGKICGC